ncbi:MAG: hypothetical protein EOO61_02355 [Hymenobacter sp.]|nr:MAG: hypothetical protein EOO61_02355 [Hymenobacter sp.]
MNHAIDAMRYAMALPKYESIYEDIYKAKTPTAEVAKPPTIINECVTLNDFSGWGKGIASAELIKQLETSAKDMFSAKPATGGMVKPGTATGERGFESWTPGSNTTAITGGQISANTVRIDKIIPSRISDDKIRIDGMKETYKTDFDENVWTIEVPGVPKEDIQVFQVRNTVYVEVKDKPRIAKYLEEDEKVDSTKLDLGVLTIVIDRPHKKVPIEIG